MISKGKTGSSFGGLNRYLLRDGIAGDAERGLQDYLLDGRSGDERSRVAWTSTRNLPTEDPELAGKMMAATAEQNVRVQKPVYHVSLSAAPGESFTRDQWERIADRMLKHLKLHEHQALLVAHRDKPHEHIHLMVNRVHTDTFKAWDNGHDYARRERALRLIERDLKLREVPGPHFRLPGQQRPDRRPELTAGERQEKARTGAEPWAEQIRSRLREPVKSATSWAELEGRLKEHGLHLKKRGRGLVITDGERVVKASRVHRGSSYAKLAERFGSTFEEWRRDRDVLVRLAERSIRIDRAKDILWAEEQKRWRDVRAAEQPLRAKEDLKDAIQREKREVTGWLARAYREDVRTIQDRLDTLIREKGYERAVEVLATDPRQLGRLQGIGNRWIGNERRVRAVDSAWSAAKHLGKAHHLNQQRRRLLPQLPAARDAAEKARRRYGLAQQVRRNLPTRRIVQKELARLATKLGLKGLELVLPKKLVIPIKAAVKAVELLNDRSRGRGR